MIGETEQKTDSFTAREFVIETTGEYPQMVKFQLVQDRCSLIDRFAEGQVVRVHFDLRGREWNGKYFTNLNAWRVEAVQEGQPTSTDVPAQEPAPVAAGEDDSDSLPF